MVADRDQRPWPDIHVVRAAAGGVCGERGSATVWLAIFVGLLVLGGTTGVALGQAATARHRAGAAADLAALAAADHALDGQQAACHRADAVARAQGGRVVACALAGEVADVVVEVRPAGLAIPVPPARVRARAGPAEGQS